MPILIINENVSSFQFEDEAWELSAQLMEELAPIVSSASSNWKF